MRAQKRPNQPLFPAHTHSRATRHPSYPTDRDAGHALLDRLKAAIAASAPAASARPHVVALDGGAPSALVAAALAATLDATGAPPAVAIVAAPDAAAAERARYVGDWLGLDVAEASDVAPAAASSSTSPLAAVAAAAAALDGVAWCGAVCPASAEDARARGVLAPLAGAPLDALAAAAAAAGVPPGLPSGVEDVVTGLPAALRGGEARPLQAA